MFPMTGSGSSFLGEGVPSEETLKSVSSFFQQVETLERVPGQMVVYPLFLIAFANSPSDE